jgi:hypothetical protein
MKVLPAAANVVSFTPRRRPNAAENDRELSRQWIRRLRADIKGGNLDVDAADKNGPVKLSSVLAVAKSLASPRYPSFWHGGIYARQSTIGADHDVSLGDRQVARVINLLVKAGYVERADQDVRKGRTCLLKPKTPAAEMSEPSDTMSSTPDKMSEESSNLKPTKDYPLNPPAEPSGNAVSGQARRSLSTRSPILHQRPVQGAPKGEIIQFAAPADDQWHRFRNAPGDAGKETDRDRGVDKNLPGEEWCEHLRRHLGNDVFRAWFAQVRTLRLENGIVTMAVKTRFMKSWIDNEYAEQLLAAWRAHDATRCALTMMGIALSSISFEVTFGMFPTTTTIGSIQIIVLGYSIWTSTISFGATQSGRGLWCRTPT